MIFTFFFSCKFVFLYVFIAGRYTCRLLYAGLLFKDSIFVNNISVFSSVEDKKDGQTILTVLHQKTVTAACFCDLGLYPYSVRNTLHARANLRSINLN